MLVSHVRGPFHCGRQLYFLPQVRQRWGAEGRFVMGGVKRLVSETIPVVAVKRRYTLHPSRHMQPQPQAPAFPTVGSPKYGPGLCIMYVFHLLLKDFRTKGQ